MLKDITLPMPCPAPSAYNGHHMAQSQRETTRKLQTLLVRVGLGAVLDCQRVPALSFSSGSVQNLQNCGRIVYMSSLCRHVTQNSPNRTVTIARQTTCQ